MGRSIAGARLAMFAPMSLPAASQPAVAADISSAAGAATRTACGRNCLTDLLDAYRDALVSHDRGRLPRRQRPRDGNGEVIAAGNGLWGTATAHGCQRRDFTDPQTGQVAAFAMLSEDDVRSIRVERLRVENGRIDDGVGRLR